MLTNIYNVFLSLICASVDPQKDLDLNNITLTDEDYVKLYKLAKKHDVAHLLGYSLKINGIMPNDSELAQKIQRHLVEFEGLKNLKKNDSINRSHKT